MGEIAVVGGTGFLGRHVCSALQEAGWTVRPLSRRNGCDARSIDPDRLLGCEAVVNLAGIKREEGDPDLPGSPRRPGRAPGPRR